VLVLDEAELAGRERADAAVEDFEVQALQVRHVAGDVKSEDLTPALACHFEAAGKTLKDGEAAAGPVPLAKDVLVCSDIRHLDRQPHERGFLLTVGVNTLSSLRITGVMVVMEVAATRCAPL
jgi:hypothetical protein